MKITRTTYLSQEQKLAIMQLWNTEYPVQLHFEDRAGLDEYLNALVHPSHYFAVDQKGGIQGWAFVFERNAERWFAVIVDSHFHKKGIGASLLNALKDEERLLNGWVTDHDRYFRSDGAPYRSPLGFYLKQGFSVCKETRLETEKLSAVKINWTKESET